MTTKTCMRASPLLGAALIVVLTMGAIAQSEKPTVSAGYRAVTTGTRDDLFPPWWRGEPGTTFQHWTFDSDQTPYWVPELYDNPYGEPWMNTYYEDEQWYDVWGGREGVVNPWETLVFLNLPNSAEPLDWKIVWIQLTWRHESGEFIPPQFLEADPPGDLVWEQHTYDGADWWHTVYEIWIPENPDFEKITLDSDHYFDQIVVDTWCAPLEARYACCVDGECVDDTTCEECTSLGGWWYHGESCFGDPPFQCPCADAIWDNGEPDFRDAVSCERRTNTYNESWVVDDVVFEEGTLLQGVHWWATTADDFLWHGKVDLILLADDGGMPGEVIYEWWDLVPNRRSDTCRDAWGRDIYVYSCEMFQIPVLAGTYWIGIRPVNDKTTDPNLSMNMTAAPNGTNECYFKSEYQGYPDWTAGSDIWGEPYEIAFCVIGEPFTGACCVDGECVATTTCEDCNDLGGWWFAEEDCFGDPPFQCPCGDALWDNGEPDFRDGLPCDRRTNGSLETWVVDDASFETNVVVRDLHWWAVTDDEFYSPFEYYFADLIILDDAGGMPGDVLFELPLLHTTRYNTCRDAFERDIYVYSIDALGIPLPAGTYWFGMRPVNYGSEGRSYNLTSAPNGTNECYFKSEQYGYPDWTAGSQVFGEAYEIAFCVTGTVSGDYTYEQPFSCDSSMWFSNVNSEHYPHTYRRFDDIVCTHADVITKIIFWGGGWDVIDHKGCDFFASLAGIQIDIHKWTEGGPCDWQHSTLLFSATIPLNYLDPVFECVGPNGTEDYYRFTASLPEPFSIEEGEHYVLMIAGVLDNPADPCIFGWGATPMDYNDPAYGYRPEDEEWSCGGPDQAFALITEAGEPCPWDFDGDGDVDTADLLYLLGAWGTPYGDVDGDGDTDTADLLALLAHWGECP